MAPPGEIAQWSLTTLRAFKPTLDVHYGEKVLAVRAGLPKFVVDPGPLPAEEEAADR